MSAICRSLLVSVALTAVLDPASAASQDDKKSASQKNDTAKRQAERYFVRNDANKDGKLTREEFPRRLRGVFDGVDANKDGFVTLEEDIRYRRERDRRRSRQKRASKLPEGFVAHRDIEYAKVGDISLKLDVYAPKEVAGQLPLIVWIHGGAWRAGNKNSCPALRFLEKGFVVASISYRLSQKALYPAQIHDCKSAIRWLRKNASKYSIDPQRFGVWGSSAGGHLVALLGTSGDVEPLEGTVGVVGVSSRVQAVCDFFGPTDFLQMDAHSKSGSPIVHDAPESPESRLVGGSIQKNKEKVAAANPITFVSKDDPPIIIFHGDSDPLVPHHQSVIFHAALEKAGVDVTFHTVEKAGHGFRGRKKVDVRVDAFFEKHLKPKTPSKKS
jgi:acetyl esterase/lipase